MTVTRDDGSTYEVEIPQPLVREFERLSEQMRKFLLRWKKAVPDGALYLQVDNPHLMAGPAHIGRNARACPENVVTCGESWNADCGDW